MGKVSEQKYIIYVVVVYHVTVVASVHGLLKKALPLVMRCFYALQGVLIKHYQEPLTSLELLNYCICQNIFSVRAGVE